MYIEAHVPTLNTGQRICTESYGLDNLFPPDDVSFDSYTACSLIC